MPYSSECVKELTPTISRMQRQMQQEQQAISNMDEDGPATKKELRPNGADQFYAKHKAEYESRGVGSGNKITEVHHHNATYPKLDDSLNRRRSLVQVGTINLAEFGPHFDPTCSACIKLATLAALFKKNIRPRCTCDACRRNGKSDKRDRLPRPRGVTKVKSKRKSDTGIRFFPNLGNASCHIITLANSKHDADIQTSDVAEDGEECNNDPDSDYSVGSFDSFMSDVDAQPMV